MIKLSELDDEFLDFLETLGTSYGLDPLSAKIFGLLYLAPCEISMDELSEKTGYSLASICNSMKLLERTGMLKSEHKPKSKKIYYSLEKDFANHANAMLELIRKKRIEPAKNFLPSLIDKYETIKTKEAKERLVLIRKYYDHILKFDRAIDYAIKEFKQ